MSGMKSPLKAVHDEPEMRAAERSYVVVEGTLILDGGREMPCEVSDISPIGAQVDIDGADLPDQVQLFVPQMSMLFEGDVRWRAGGRIGLRFNRATRQGD